VAVNCRVVSGVTNLESPGVEVPGRRMVSTSVLITSLWVAICAVAPEFIWQGMRTAYEHPDWSDLLSALLIGLILAFFVEPATERIRDLFHPVDRNGDFGKRRPATCFTPHP
jgi:hypothetical protein